MLPPGLSMEENNVYQYMKILGVTFTSDDGFILAGEYLSSPGGVFSNTFQSAYAYKLDEHGCYEPNCHVGVEEIEEPKQSFSLIPNPVAQGNNIQCAINNVQWSLESIEGSMLKIYNLTGKLVKQLIIDNSQLIIETEGLESGIYIVKIGELSQKLVIN
jgi:hypothetical protein